MTDNAYFFDTYAILETLRSSPKYRPYLAASAVTTKLSLFELYCGLRRVGKTRQEALATVKEWAACAVDYDVGVIRDAAEMWLEQRGRDISMTDCIGYVIARRLGIRFLTGDAQFRDMPNVEFVK